MSVINSLSFDWSGLVLGNTYKPTSLPYSVLLGFTMVTVVFYLRAILGALLILGTHAFPTKGSKSQDQSSGSIYSGGHSGFHRERPGGPYAAMSYSAPRDVPMMGQSPGSSQLVYTSPGSGSLPSGTLQAGYPVGTGYVPVEAGSAQATPPETKWSVAPKIFSEEGLANNEILTSNDVGASTSLPAPSGPVLQSGETSSVLKEAELGNFQQETEEVGYPAGPGFPSDTLASPVVPYVGGPWVYPNLYPYLFPYPYPQFDYRLLYGLYPPGTYTTFNKHHEKGKDHYQSIHYLKTHGPGSESADTPGSSGQQTKFFPYGA